MSSMFTDKQAKELVGTPVFVDEAEGCTRWRVYGTVIEVRQGVHIATEGNEILIRPVEKVSLAGDAWWNIVSKGVV